MSSKSKTNQQPILTLKEFEHIYTTYAPKVYSLCVYRLLDKETALDIVQEVFAKFWQYRSNYNPNRPVENYIVSIAKNQIIDHYKKRNLLALNMEAEKREIPASPNPEELLVFEEQKNLALRTFKKFPVRTREVFLMSRKNAMKTKEIAKKLSISEKSVEYHITKALKLMRAYLIKS
ncbi:MAG: sigma-70 family RNA polymerase sigma factor [Bacteroidota bacterium]